jgi:hypothetical protein
LPCAPPRAWCRASPDEDEKGGQFGGGGGKSQKITEDNFETCFWNTKPACAIALARTRRHLTPMSSSKKSKRADGMQFVTLSAWDSESSATEMLNLSPVPSDGDESRVGAGVPPFSLSARIYCTPFRPRGNEKTSGQRTEVVEVTLSDEARDDS